MNIDRSTKQTIEFIRSVERIERESAIDLESLNFIFHDPSARPVLMNERIEQWGITFDCANGELGKGRLNNVHEVYAYYFGYKDSHSLTVGFNSPCVSVEDVIAEFGVPAESNHDVKFHKATWVICDGKLSMEFVGDDCRELYGAFKLSQVCEDVELPPPPLGENDLVLDLEDMLDDIENKSSKASSGCKPHLYIVTADE
jgi:hypothetical protein